MISPVEDVNWTDPAGNRTAIGEGKVSHIWGLAPERPADQLLGPVAAARLSYQMCGPIRGRFRAVNLSASGSYVFVIGRHGDMWTRLYDFDIAGHDPLFFNYSYDDQTGKGDGAPIQLPGAPWVKQPKIGGRITSAISIEKTGVDAVHRILRVEGPHHGHTGYWQRDVADRPSLPWIFHRTDLPLSGRRLHNPPRDTSRRGLGPHARHRYVMAARRRARRGAATSTSHCSPARLSDRRPRQGQHETLYTVDGLRQAPRASGLDDNAARAIRRDRGQPTAASRADRRGDAARSSCSRSSGWTLEARPAGRRR